MNFTTPSLLACLMLGLSGSVVAAPQSQKAAKAPAAGSASSIDYAKHPFLDPQQLPAWSKMTPQKLEVDTLLALKQSQANIDAICTVKKPDFDNTIAALELAVEPLDTVWGRAMTLDSLSDDAEQRKVIAKLTPKVSAFFASISLNDKLWSVIKNYAESEQAKALQGEKKRLLQLTLDSFKNNGADLPADKKQRVAQIQSRLSLLSKDFQQKVKDSTNAWEFITSDKNMLEGLPEAVKAAALADAKAAGKATDKLPAWRFTQQFTSYGPVMQFAKSDELRKRMWEGRCSIGNGKYDTEKLIWEILSLRGELAAILGYDNFADFKLHDRMAGNGSKALAFIEDMHMAVRPAFVKEMQALADFKAKKTGEKVQKLSPWELSYWSEQQRKELFNFDSEELRQYYAIENVMDGVFAVASKLYDLRFEELPTTYKGAGGTKNQQQRIETWHKDVKFYAVYDNKSGKLLGRFYTDWHPRKSKRGGAWMSPLDVGYNGKDGREAKPHLAIIAGNLTKPLEGKPALLDHREVETVFHEFGHLLHVLLSDTERSGLGGTSVSWDFVELPSQILENWTWEQEAMDLYAKHFKTGEKMPTELYAKMLAARNFQSANQAIRQCAVAKFDLDLHMNPAKFVGKSIDEVDREVLKDYRVDLTHEQPSLMRSLNHVFAGGYSAGYYSYKWAEALDADAFGKFKQEGILNPKVGAKFRETVLSKGNTKPAMELFVDFMGREPDKNALLKRSGIEVSEPATSN